MTRAKLAMQLIKFYQTKGLLSDDLLKRFETLMSDPQKLEQFFLKHNSVYHKICYDSFNDSHYERALRALSRRKRLSDEDIHGHHTPDGPPRTRRKSDKLHLGDAVCFICGKPETTDKKHPDRIDKLHAAAAKSASAEHVAEFTENLRLMASVLISQTSC